jgi:hypothetical protein
MVGTQKIESVDLTLADLLKDFYSVPDFQREYVWQQDQVERLLMDVVDEFYDEEGRLEPGEREYFIGSIVACHAEDGTLALIDGQQRLTTIYLVLCAIRDSLLSQDAGRSSTLEQQLAATSADSSGNDVHRFRLSLQYEDSAGVLDEIASGADLASIQQSTASVRNILNAYETIREYLRTQFEDDPELVRRFYAAFTGRVKLIRIITPDIAHALKVFETVNDRGVGLNAMDLLKNLLFMKAGPASFELLKTRWRGLVDTLESSKEKPLRFLRYYIMANHDLGQRELREDQIYGWLRDRTATLGIDAHPLDFIDELSAAARAYLCFTQGQSPDGSSNRHLESIAALSGGTRQHYILLLAAREQPTKRFVELCRRIENLLFCYIITREGTKLLERNFQRWSKELREVDSDEALAAFCDKTFVPDVASRIDRFDFAFQQLTTARLQQYRMRYVLARLTQFVDEQAFSNPPPLRHYLDKKVHVEHILPQEPAEGVREAFDRPDEYFDYVPRLGNLMLLEETINTSVSNHAFEKKRAGYGQSSFLLTKSLVGRQQVGVNTKFNRAVAELPHFETWDSSCIERRQEAIRRLAHAVWDVPFARADALEEGNSNGAV